MQAVLQFIQDYWIFIIAFLGLSVGGYYVPVVRGALVRIWAAFMSEKIIIKVIMYLLGLLVKSTKNQLDDQLYEDLSEALGVHQKKVTKEAGK
ncbi:MAG: hypothetical protein U5N56_00065 [Candidatus Marinimicrobia bacterium]|nr:hypothetical protein [Candidatus Neomarinimicrobiota bacterium]